MIRSLNSHLGNTKLTRLSMASGRSTDLFRSARRRLRSLFLRMNLDVRHVQSLESTRLRQAHDQQLEKWRFLKRYGLHSVLDIGANCGQFATLAREILPEPRIYSFEPLASCYAELVAQLGTLQPAEAFQCALGEKNGKAIINRNGFSPSSSLLPMKALHWEELPHTAHATNEEITVRRLDDVFADRAPEPPFFVKLDVQGFEDQVLRGGEMTIRNAVAVVLEMSSYRLYEGQPLFDDLYSLMRDWNFVYRGNVDQWLSRQDGSILQFDGLFENTVFSRAGYGSRCDAHVAVAASDTALRAQPARDLRNSCL